MTDPRGETSILRIVTPLLQRWRTIAAITGVFVALAVAYALIVTPTYTARTTFTPETAGGTSLPASLAGAASLAGQLGISLGTASGPNAEFFVEVLRSREVMVQTLTSEFREDSASPARSLLDILEVQQPDSARRIEVGIRVFSPMMNAAVDRRTGIVVVTVTLESPRLAAQVANRMVAILNEFNLERRQSQSREQKRFVGERLQETERELRTAEERQLRFLQSNRRYQDSPLLQHEFSRLQREVEAKQAVFVTLTRAFEEARVSEVRDTPLLTVIDRAAPPVFKTSPKRKLIVLAAMMLGLMFSVTVVYLGVFLSSARRSAAEDYDALASAWADARSSISRLNPVKRRRA